MFTYGFSGFETLLFVGETRTASKMSVTFVEGKRTSEYAHGGLVMQSLHVWTQTCVISLLQLLLHALQKYFFAMAAVS